MVVIPTENQVKLTYSKTPLDWFFYSLTLFGIALCVYWRRKGDMVFPSDRPDWGTGPADEPGVEAVDEPVIEDVSELVPAGTPPAPADDAR
jgi:hypothetical protein